MSTTPMVRIARTQMRPIVVKLLNAQGGLCPLCRSIIDLSIPKEGVLDHDHNTGEVRGILHRWCNGQLGKVEAAAIRAKKAISHTEWLENAIVFIKTGKSGLMYPSHKTEDEVRAARALKEKQRRAKIKMQEIMKARGAQNDS